MKLLNPITKLYSDLWLDLIFPKRCFGCKTYNAYLCQKCFQSIPAMTPQRCIACQKASLNGFTHPKCRRVLGPDRLITFFPYQNRLIAELIKQGKYQFVSDVFVELASYTSNLLLEQIVKPTQYILCAIPLHTKKLRWRGFNQAEVITKTYQQTVGLASNHNLSRRRFTKPQKDLDADQRELNLRDAFIFTQPQEKIYRVILVDDVTTTGTTFLQACKALKRQGVQEVICLAIAQD